MSAKVAAFREQRSLSLDSGPSQVAPNLTFVRPNPLRPHSVEVRYSVTLSALSAWVHNSGDTAIPN